MTGLAYYRMESNETLEAFGKRIGVSKQLVSFWERGERSIPKKHHEKLEHTTGVLIDLLSKKEINELDKVEIKGQIINANLSCLNEIELREKMKRIDIEKEKEMIIQNIRDYIECKYANIVDEQILFNEQERNICICKLLVEILNKTREKTIETFKQSLVSSLVKYN